MMSEADTLPDATGPVAYLVLKTARDLYGKGPEALAPEEREKVRRLADRQYSLEARVLATVEARDVVVPDATLQAALDEVRGRYPSRDDYRRDLAANGLDEAEFAAALARELKVEATLEKVASRAAQVSDIDVELYYHYHPEQFRRPETRRLRHILVTINESLAENTRAAAQARIQSIAERLSRHPERFEEQALKHSECPTAMEGGLLGNVTPGKLYPELESVAFALAAGQISAVVESEIGFHILRCDEIHPALQVSLADARAQLRQVLEKRRRRVCQQAWMKALLTEAETVS